MDESVKRALEKWPDVPAAYGWLALNRRGDWLLQGERVVHRGLIEFINRHYRAEHQGSTAGQQAWCFQNGPQKVFVDLEYTPLVFSLIRGESGIEGEPGIKLVAHTNVEVGKVTQCWIDEEGSLLLQTNLGPGLVDGRDLILVESFFRGKGGAELSLNDLSKALDSIIAGEESGPIYFCYLGAQTKIGSINFDKVSELLGFIPHPTEHKSSAG